MIERMKHLYDVIQGSDHKERVEPDHLPYDITLHARVEHGSSIQSDINCGTTFMLNSIHEICIDNTGGHGTNKGKEEYDKILYEDYFIILLWQVPNSPETNMLDLRA